MSWQNKVVLLTGEKIVRGQKREKGNLGQTEIWPFKIENENGDIVGDGRYTEHTNVRGLDTSYILEYSKTDGTKFSEYW